MRFAPLLTIVLLPTLSPREAWCETEAQAPSTVIGAFIDGDPANDAVEAAAQEIAAALHIERTAQAHTWQNGVRDDYASPPFNELADAQAYVWELCPGAVSSDMMTP